MDPGKGRCFLSDVRLLVERRIVKVFTQSVPGIDTNLVAPGKMLRSRLAARLLPSGPSSVNRASVQATCAATELAHTASLCHDDVVDNSLIRRSLPTLWRSAGPSGAILIGDLLFCEAMDLLTETKGGRYLPQFIAKVGEVVQAEAEQELLWRGKRVDVETCLRLARGKTGPLFAFVAGTCGGDDEALCGALEEAGYRIGTAYQLADDLLDLFGTESSAGKTLGTDSVRGKFTLPRAGDEGQRITRSSVSELCISALETLNAYPRVREGLTEFLLRDLQGVLDRHLGVDTEIAV